MAIKLGLGNFINGSFINHGTTIITSKNPSADFEPVFSVATDISHVPKAVHAAKVAQKNWARTSMEQRIECLKSLKHAFIKHEMAMADAISSEMGKIKSEALIEAKGLSARVDLMIQHGLKRVAEETIYDMRAKTRYHQQGTLAVVGPYNFPAHLVNAHVIPAVLLGNSVIIKPSEVCPQVAEIYAQCVKESTIPSGVINVLHGDHIIANALVDHELIDGILFTGSYKTGRLLQEKLLDQPHKILALEMGGKNFAVVMDDANIKQAVLEIIMGAFLTTGQRCTATSRVLCHEKIFAHVREHLIAITKDLKPCKAHEHGMFGPMATKGALDRYMHGLMLAKKTGAEVLVESTCQNGGAFVTPSLYQVGSNHPLQDYLGEELFGPNIALEPFHTLDDAIVRINQSPYGLSNAIFTLDEKNVERLYQETKSGVLNVNRSTNNAVGQMPFGGVNKSGNQRPAGIDAVRYVTFPTAILAQAYGEYSAPKALSDIIESECDPLLVITMRHHIESAFEVYGIYSDFAASDLMGFHLSMHEDRPGFVTDLKKVFGPALKVDGVHCLIKVSAINDPAAAIKELHDVLQRHASALWFDGKKTPVMNIPEKAQTPKSRAMLDRLYRDHFVPKDKKSLVADMQNSQGAYLASIDDNPLVIFDAASQIATLGAGFLADTFQNAYDTNQFDEAILTNVDLSIANPDENAHAYQDACAARKKLEEFLHARSKGAFKSIAYASSGAESNEVAFDLCRQHGPGGTRIIAFEGAFHGRTIMALQATYNKEKRGPFAFKGYEATFIPFPENKNPEYNPPLPEGFLASLARGEVPGLNHADALLKAELESFHALKHEIEKGNICAVIIEPMQCEGGDRYATNRFFSGLRALTKALGVPLIFDEVQTGFHLGREFFWYQQVNLVDHAGNPQVPDCVTMAKKAQLGMCMSVWPNLRSYAPHVVHLKRALLHALALDQDTIVKLERKALHELKRLQEYFPGLVSNGRACGLAFAFDMPTNALAMELIDQRFMYGFMAYIAGERTLRFRLNMVSHDEIIQKLFEKLFMALVDIRDRQTIERVAKSAKPSDIDVSDKVTITRISVENFDHYRPFIEAIENQAYEEGRRDSMEYLLSWLKAKESVALIMHYAKDNENIVAGYAFGGPLEHAQVDGPKQDPNYGRHNTFYAANLTMNERVRGLGLGRLLKNAQVHHAMAVTKTDGSLRYQFMTGRNRIGATPAMNQIIDALGAYMVSTHDNQYGEEGARALYYRLPLARLHHDVVRMPQGMLDCRNSLQNAFHKPPPSLVDALANNHLRAILGTKLTLSNWATPFMVRYSELLRTLMPKPLNHVYFTSGRDEMIDKGLRSLRFHRLEADMVIGFSHQWLGHNTAAARSLSHEEGQTQPFSFFSWPKVPHPHVVGHEKSLQHLKDLLARTDAQKILGIVVELLGEKSGFVFDESYLQELDAIRTQTGIPLVYVDNASSLARSGRDVFLTSALPVKPNMVLWYTGGQLGQVMVDDNYFVEKPLTLISTWDGDEISMMRAYHNLLFATDESVQKKVMSFEHEIMRFKDKLTISGMGCWYSVRLKSREQVKQAQDYAQQQGVLLGEGYDNSLMVCLRPDFDQESFEKVFLVIKNLC